MNPKSSITDRPITGHAENVLGIEDYATALASFIRKCATPLTVGIQGEWGTGKTSLMYLIKEQLEDEIATAWVNTWEYSLFKHANETTPAVLKGLLGDLLRECERKNYKEITNTEVMDKVRKGLVLFAKFAVKAVAKQAADLDVNLDGDFLKSPQLRSEVAEVKNEVQQLIRIIVNSEKNPVKKVVFFVDDLDRIEPGVAVEILEALKNIFDIDSCVFVLAIDYDVVIKGLEKKFGAKTDANEREFRSFFDKIIQVPFTMPVGTYDINKLLSKSLVDLGLKEANMISPDFIEVIKCTVGYIPRSVKRFINTYSLLKRIIQAGTKGAVSQDDDLGLFTLLGMQIAYPQIFRLLNKDPDYLSWDASFAQEIGIDMDTLKVPDRKNEYLDEKWEQVLWAYCQSDAYLRAKAFLIIKTFNILRTHYGKDGVTEAIEAALEYAAMTAVDDNTEAKVKTYRKATEASFLMECSDASRGRFEELFSLLHQHSIPFRMGTRGFSIQNSQGKSFAEVYPVEAKSIYLKKEFLTDEMLGILKKEKIQIDEKGKSIGFGIISMDTSILFDIIIGILRK